MIFEEVSRSVHEAWRRVFHDHDGIVRAMDNEDGLDGGN